MHACEQLPAPSVGGIELHANQFEHLPEMAPAAVDDVLVLCETQAPVNSPLLDGCEHVKSCEGLAHTHKGDAQALLVLPSLTEKTKEVFSATCIVNGTQKKRLRNTQDTGQISVLSFLSVLQTREATQLAKRICTSQFGYSKPVPVQLLQMHVKTPPPPESQFHVVTTELREQLQQHTKMFDGVVRHATNSELLLAHGAATELVPCRPGQHVLMWPKHRFLKQALHLYNQVKCLDQNTSGVLVVPYNQATKHPIKGWQEIHSLTMSQPGHSRVNKYAVLSDWMATSGPSVLDQYEYVHLFRSRKHTMAVNAVVAGTQLPVLLDTGATGTGFIAKAYAQELNLVIHPQAKRQMVKMGDNHTTQSCGLCVVPLRMGTYKTKVQCLVMPALPDYAVVLGDPWLTAVKADLKYSSGCVTIHTPQGTEVTLQSTSVSPQKVPQNLVMNPSDSSNPLQPLSLQPQIVPSQDASVVKGKKVAKWVQKNQLDYCYLAFVSDVPESDQPMLMAADVSDVDDRWVKAVPQSDPTSLQLRALLMSKQHLFQEELAQLPPVRLQREVIPLMPGASVPNRPLFRYSQPELEEMKKQVSDLLSKGLINTSSSPFGAPVLFVKKKDGTMRMCIDYRGLNNVTVPNRYPLPRVDDLLDRLQGATVFSSLDLLSGYHQIRLLESDVAKTAFKTPFGLYEFRVMPFGLTNAPAVFMAHMNDILHHLPFCVVYLDDILIYSKTPEQHVDHVRQVLEVLEQHHYLLKLKKCDFFKKELLYLGHVISSDGIRPDPKKVQAILNYPVPETVHQLRSFMGLVNWFHKSLQDLAKLASPLTDLLAGPNVSRRKSASTDIKHKWTPACAQAFDAVKQAMANAATLKLPDLNQPFQVITDASDYALGAILLQEGRPVAFESWKMTSAQRNYHTTDRQGAVGCCACIEAMEVLPQWCQV